MTAICVALKVINEQEYIEHSLNMWYPCASRILVIEGADSYMRRSTSRLTPGGLSTDGTTEIVESFPDPEGKIEHVKMGFYQEEEESFQRMLLGLEAGDILWTAAPDEFFFQDDIGLVLERLKGNYLQVQFPFRTYWHDFYHRLRGGGWDIELARAWVLVEGADKLSMVGKGATLCDSQGRDYNHEYYGGATWESSILLHHFSYVRAVQKIMEKQLWQLRIEEKFDEATENSPICSPRNLDCWALKQRYKTPENFIQRNFCWFTHEYDERFGIYVEAYNGPWPEALADHKYREELVWDEEPVLFY